MGYAFCHQAGDALSFDERRTLLPFPLLAGGQVIGPQNRPWGRKTGLEIGSPVSRSIWRPFQGSSDMTAQRSDSTRPCVRPSVRPLRLDIE